MAIARDNRIVRKTVTAFMLVATVVVARDATALGLSDSTFVGTPGPRTNGGATPTFEFGGNDGPTFEAAPITDAIRLRFPLAGPDRRLCARSNGSQVARTQCRGSELTIDPTALTLCRAGNGVLRLTANGCSKSESRIDMRTVRGVTPSAWRKSTPAAAAANGFAKDGFSKSGGSLLDGGVTIEKETFGSTFDPSPAPTSKGDFAVQDTKLELDPKVTGPGALFQIRDGLCRRSNGKVSLHALCPAGETPIDPDDLRSCVKKSGELVLRGSGCPKGAKSTDLRDFRTPGAPVGIGPLVGIVPRLADLSDEYPGL